MFLIYKAVIKMQQYLLIKKLTYYSNNELF